MTQVSERLNAPEVLHKLVGRAERDCREGSQDACHRQHRPHGRRRRAGACGREGERGGAGLGRRVVNAL
jgi:hypothetical protein